MQTIFVGGEFLAQDLDRDFASELHVLGKVDLTHATRAELFEYSIMRDFLRIHKNFSHKKAQKAQKTFLNQVCFLKSFCAFCAFSWLKTPIRSTQQCSRYCLLKEPQDQNRNERRNINPTERRDRSSQWSQQRLSHVNQKTHHTVRVADHPPREDNANRNEQNVNRD